MGGRTLVFWPSSSRGNAMQTAASERPRPACPSNQRSIIHDPATPITARHTHACLSLGHAQIASFRSEPLSDFYSWWCGGVCSQDRMLRPLQGYRPTSTTTQGSSRSTSSTRPIFCTLHVRADSAAKAVSRSASRRAAGQWPRPASPSEPHCEWVPRAATPHPSP